MSDARRIGRNTAVQLGGEVLSKVLSMAFYAVMARELGQDGFGAFTFALSLALLTTTFSGFGTDPIVTRAVARDGGDHALLWPAIVLKSALGAVAVAAALGIATASGSATPTIVAVGLLGVAAVVELVSKSLYATFQGLEDMVPVTAALLLQRTSTAIAGIVALLLGAEVVAVAAVYLGGALLAQAWAHRRLRARGVRPQRRAPRPLVARLARDGLPIGLATLLGTILFRVDTLLLELLDTTEAVGRYGAAFRLLETTLFVSYAFVAALLPVLSRATRDSVPSAAELFSVGLKVLAVVLVPLALTFVLFAAPIVELLYGEAFAGAASALRLLGGATALFGVTYLAGYVLVSQGAERVMPWVTAAVLAQNVALNLVLIPRHSADAAAAATSISEATLAAALTVLAVRRTGPLQGRRILTGPAAGAAAMVAVALLLGEALWALPLALAAYGAALVAAERLAHPTDLELLAGVIARRDAAAVAPSPPAGGGASGPG